MNTTHRIIGLIETLKNVVKKLGGLILKHLPFIEKFLLSALKMHFEFKDYFKDEKAKTSRRSRNTTEISLRQKLIISAETEMKNLK